MSKEDNKNNWIQTFMGKRFNVFDPKPEDVDIRDIAYSLSNIPRFTGHSVPPYYVGDHSCRVASILPQELKLWGLLHDNGEAYLNDLSLPLKRSKEFSFYREIEENVLEVIVNKFGLSFPMPPEVKQADTILLATEARDLMKPDPEWNIDFSIALPNKIFPHSSRLVYHQFLEMFNSLIGNKELQVEI